MEKIKVSSCCSREAVVAPDTKYQCTHCECECKLVEYPDSGKIKYMIEPGSIEWEMNWHQFRKADGTLTNPEKPDKEIIFETEPALALLLNNEVLHLNNHWWEKDWPEKAINSTYLGVNCSDVFSWGCADSEEIYYSEIEELYRMYKADPRNGPTLWCMKKRREMPQDPVAEAMRKEGVDLDAFQKEHNLRVNFYSGCSALQAKFKYETYAWWATESGVEVLPFDKHWWEGWEAFKKSNPSWEKTVGEVESKRIRAEFMRDNGWEGEVK